MPESAIDSLRVIDDIALYRSSNYGVRSTLAILRRIEKLNKGIKVHLYHSASTVAIVVVLWCLVSLLLNLNFTSPPPLHSLSLSFFLLFSSSMQSLSLLSSSSFYPFHLFILSSLSLLFYLCWHSVRSPLTWPELPPSFHPPSSTTERYYGRPADILPDFFVSSLGLFPLVTPSFFSSSLIALSFVVDFLSPSAGLKPCVCPLSSIP